jgi:UDP-2,4-diacetamido-2,4,6-trideoxy-beta-L-altropyranose hydrolase
MLSERGHEFVLLPSASIEAVTDDLPHSRWLGTSQLADSQATILALSDQTWDWLVVDHYALDARWESILRRAARRIFVIDDLADRMHDCDVLLDQNFYADQESRYIGKVPMHCRLLLGLRYALLRDEFRQLREKVKPRTGEVNRILVCFGGMDVDNYTARVIAALCNIGSQTIHVDVVIGAQHPHREQIESICADQDFSCHVQTNRMAELMYAADMAVGAGGSTTWDRCCMGLPTLTVSTADNHRKQIVDAASEGLVYAPETKDDLTLLIERHVRALVENNSLRHVISRNSMQAVDGRGVLRVTEELDCSGIEIRAAREDDSQKLFEWRNHPTIRAVSRSSDMISWESHQKWFASVLTATDKFLLIGQIGGIPVGVARFDRRSDEAEVSIYLVPDTPIPCKGRDLLRSAERWFVDNQPDVHKICAYVLEGNACSQHLFLGAGYQVEATWYSKMIH